MNTGSQTETASAITAYKQAQQALKQEKIRVEALRARLSELNERADGLKKTADEMGKRKQSVFSDVALGNAPESTLLAVREKHDEAIRNLENTQEMIATVQAVLSSEETTVKHKKADRMEQEVWAHIVRGLQSDMPKEVKTWIERLSASSFKATRAFVSLTYPFGDYNPTEEEVERRSSVIEEMKQEIFL